MRRTALAAIGIALVLGACSPADTAVPSTEATTTTVDETPTTAAATTTTVGTTTAATPTTTVAPQTTTTSTTTAPTSTTLPGVWWLADDLFCRDLNALGYPYPEAALYWSVFETPDRMDADRNGIPCETVYPQADVVDFWGDPADPGVVAIAEVAAWIQGWYDADFTRSNPPEDVLGPSQIQCPDHGPVDPGDVFVCEGVPQAKHPDLDTFSLHVLVLDASGTAAWSAGTDGWDNTAALRYAYWLYPKGLSCDDLVERNAPIGLFSGDSRPPDDAFFYAMVYWSLEGRPSYMDPDGNGIPCEELTSSENVATILQGGPVPLYTRN
ncbi:MAG: hypothetical protein QNJ75_13690 [Acidimicrobiia bacterium]|nr:hypothetical protein [Acidimicrobiia bacterium]